MVKKSHDYQNPNSSVRQADYYPRGVESILDIVRAKYLRMVSLVEAYKADGSVNNNESIEDSAKDLINYSAFIVAYMRKKIDGQDPNRDMLNQKSTFKVSNNSLGEIADLQNKNPYEYG